MHDLTARDFAHLFGATERDMEDKCGTAIEQLDFRHHRPSPADRDRILLSILKRIDSEDLVAAGAHRKTAWEDGWRENLDDFISSDFDLAALIPKYHKRHKQGAPVRLNGDFIIPTSPEFVYNVTHIFRSWLFQTYLKQYSTVYEFGCGTGHNLAYLASLYPEKEFFGFDWAPSSQEIIELLARKCGCKISGKNFDFFKPDKTIRFSAGSAVYTFGALEQIGKNHTEFLNFLLERGPALCINVEGLNELYDPENLYGYLALKYHQKRNYLDSYLSALRGLESEGKINIIKVHYQPFGFYDDPHSYVVWKPVGDHASVGHDQ